MKKLLTNSKSNFARNLGLALVLIVPIICATSCKKDDPEPACTDYTNPECPNYDPCWQAQQDYNTANNNYLNTRRQCLQVYLPQCFSDIEGFKANYDIYVPRDDSLLSVQSVVNDYLHFAPQYLVGHEALADSANQTSIRALSQEAVRDSVYNANQNCLQ